MLANALAWSKTKKTLKNDQKHTFFIMGTRGSCMGLRRNMKKNVVLKTVFFIIVTKGLCGKLVEFTLNLSGATRFWVSTSVWESLLNAKKLHFSSYFCLMLVQIHNKLGRIQILNGTAILPKTISNSDKNIWIMKTSEFRPLLCLQPDTLKNRPFEIKSL